MKKLIFALLITVSLSPSVSLFAARDDRGRNSYDPNLYFYNRQAVRETGPGGTYYYQQNDEGTNYYYNQGPSRIDTNRDYIFREAEDMRSGAR